MYYVFWIAGGGLGTLWFLLHIFINSISAFAVLGPSIPSCAVSLSTDSIPIHLCICCISVGLGLLNIARNESANFEFSKRLSFSLNTASISFHLGVFIYLREISIRRISVRTAHSLLFLLSMSTHLSFPESIPQAASISLHGSFPSDCGGVVSDGILPSAQRLKRVARRSAANTAMSILM